MFFHKKEKLAILQYIDNSENPVTISQIAAFTGLCTCKANRLSLRLKKTDLVKENRTIHATKIPSRLVGEKIIPVMQYSITESGRQKLIKTPKNNIPVMSLQA